LKITGIDTTNKKLLKGAGIYVGSMACSDVFKHSENV